jgi:hypothetical protein
VKNILAGAWFLSAGLAFAACTSSAGNGADGGRDGGGDAIVSTPCPAAAPAQGASCSGAASCPYGTACNQTISVCTGGFWENSPAVLMDGGSCPPSPPAEGAACAICPSTGPCAYDTACEPDAGGTMTSAVCKGGAWSVTTTACPFDAGMSDAGAPDAPSEADASTDAPVLVDAPPGDAGDAADH